MAWRTIAIAERGSMPCPATAYLPLSAVSFFHSPFDPIDSSAFIFDEQRMRRHLDFYSARMATRRRRRQHPIRPPMEIVDSVSPSEINNSQFNRLKCYCHSVFLFILEVWFSVFNVDWWGLNKKVFTLHIHHNVRVWKRTVVQRFQFSCCSFPYVLWPIAHFMNRDMISIRSGCSLELVQLHKVE